MVGSPKVPALEHIGSLAEEQMTNQTYLAVIVFLFYEFFLTLDQEVEHIWKHRWSPTSALYIFVRYFGTLYNLSIIVLRSIGRTDKTCKFIIGSQAWACLVIVWTVQVILQMRLYALYRGSKRLLVFMVTFFVAEVGIMLWFLISTTPLYKETFAMHLYIIAYYHHNIEECVSHAIRSYNGPVWIPLLAFEAVLALLAIWVGIKHSRQGPRSKSSRFSKPQLADSLIHGNVIYFVSPLVTFVLLHNGNPQIQLVAQVIFWAAPITISAGCRLILSIREAAYSQYLTSVSHRTTSTLAEASHCVRGHIKGDCEACGHDTGLARYDLRGAS